MTGQLFPCSSNAWTKAWVGNTGAISLSCTCVVTFICVCSVSATFLLFSLFSHVSENLYPFLKPAFCRSPKMCLLSGLWRHPTASLIILTRASPIPVYGPGPQFSSAWRHQSLCQGCHRGILSHSLLSLNCLALLDWICTLLVTLPLPDCWVVSRMC